MQIKNFMQLIFLVACTFTAYAANDNSEVLSKEELNAISFLIPVVNRVIRIGEGRLRESSPRDNAYQYAIGITQDGILTIFFQKNAENDDDGLVKRRCIKKEKDQELWFDKESLQQEDPEARVLKEKIQQHIINGLRSNVASWQSMIKNKGSLQQMDIDPTCILLDVKTSSGKMTSHEDWYEIVMKMS